MMLTQAILAAANVGCCILMFLQGNYPVAALNAFVAYICYKGATQ